MSGNTRHVINMANSIVGVSILSMPYCFKEAGLVLATILVLFSGLLTKRTCMYLIRSAMMSRRRSYELLAFQVFGVAGKLLMELCLICFLVGICISFHVVMGDLAPSIVANYMNIENSASLRSTILCGIVLLVILPLCLLRNIDSLASMSACSIGFYVFLNSIVFYAALPRLLDGSWLSMVKLWEVKKAFHVLPIMSLALSCQSNVFEIYDSIPDPDIAKMKSVIEQAVNLCCALYIGVGFLGYIAFADVAISGNIIMSFPNSGLTDGIKMLFVISLAISFPLMMFPCRTSIHSLFYRSVSQVSYTDLVGNFMPEIRFRVITVVILVLSLIIGILLPNIEFVLGLLGSTMGMLIAIILPSLFYIKVYSKLSADRILAQGLLLFGLIIMVTGTFIHLHSIGKTNDVLIEKTAIKKLTDDAVKIIPVIPDTIGNPVKIEEKLSGRKEPAIPEPPKVILPEPPKISLPEVKNDVNKDTGNVLKLESNPVKKPDLPTVSKPGSPEQAKAPELEGLHPDAIKHEEKEKAVEDKGKEVIEEKQEKILNYIEEQQKKQNEMLEILHELKDKTDKKPTVKPGSVVDLKFANNNVNAIKDTKIAKDLMPPMQLTKLLHKNAVDKTVKKIIPPQKNKSIPDTYNLSKIPDVETDSNLAGIHVIRPAKMERLDENKSTAFGNQASNHISNKSNKHDEERKRRDLREFERGTVLKKSSHFDTNSHPVQNNMDLPNIPRDLKKEAVLSLLDNNQPKVLLTHADIETRRLLWTDFKVRRRKKHQNGEEYWDEI